MREAGPLIASGRDADIYECGHGLVLRRSRRARSMALEARVMEYVRAAGYPVPAVEEISGDGTELVMERVPGVSMVEYLGRRPWTVRRQGELLAELHRRLHQIGAPDWLGPGPWGPGPCVVHLDLHPLNVLIAPHGPVVIDWAGAVSGEAADDVALSWALMASGAIPGNRLTAALLGLGRRLLVGAFLNGVDAASAAARLPDIVAWKVGDPNMTEAEQRAMWALVGRSVPRDDRP